MKKSTNNSKIQFITGRKRLIFNLRFAISLVKYIFQKKKYPLFSLSSIHQYRKNKVVEIPKIPRLERYHYTAIPRTPRWPSKAFDLMVANGGLNLHASGTPMKNQIDFVVLGISKKCNFNCEHCYEHPHLNSGDPVDNKDWIGVIKHLQKHGTSIIVLSGGEPMLRFEALLEILNTADTNRSDFHIQSAGDGITLNKALSLKKTGLAAAGISLDDFRPEEHDRFRGYQGAFTMAVDAIDCFNQAGIFTYVNLCLRKSIVHSDRLWKFFDFVKDLGVGAMTMLEPKPSGKYYTNYDNNFLTEEDKKTVLQFFHKANHGREYKNHPFVTYTQFYERPEIFGCLMGGLSHFYINTSGEVLPCVFTPVTFGNIKEEDFSIIFSRMRNAVPGPLKKECPAYYFADTLNNNMTKNGTFPIPFAEIEKDWTELFET